MGIKDEIIRIHKQTETNKKKEKDIYAFGRIWDRKNKKEKMKKISILKSNLQAINKTLKVGLDKTLIM